MESSSNNTENYSLSNSEGNLSFPTEQGPQMQSNGTSCALDEQSGETASNGANAGAQSPGGSESRGESAIGSPPGRNESSSPHSGELPPHQQDDSFWTCCGGIPSGCPRSGVWLRANTPACLDCEHRVCSNCELKHTEGE
ncbi:hypothetical protein C7212DRAFT_281226 [Tuber magnatum]|uniref:Uncharacterized protein n=1 Tax=Tuber magnatum TaxID=42249 RepID=A0A317SY28_9PEZI|nr:hypothetical protein C7212DRAFT_281226 [Tuber magnatum]